MGKIRDLAVKNNAKMVSTMAKKFEEITDVKMPEDLKDEQKIHDISKKIVSDENLDRISKQTKSMMETTAYQLEKDGWTTPKGISRNVVWMLEDAKELTTNLNNGLKEIMMNYAKVSQLMDRVEQDASQGVVGYDENGDKILDLDLLDKEKEALKSEDQRQLENEQRQMQLFANLLPQMYPEEWKVLEQVFNDPEVQKAFMENLQKNLADYEAQMAKNGHNKM